MDNTVKSFLLDYLKEEDKLLKSREWKTSTKEDKTVMYGDLMNMNILLFEIKLYLL